MRLIDADALIDKLRSAIECGKRVDMPTGELEAVLNDVSNAPSIDIVRCCICKHCKDTKGNWYGRCDHYGHGVNADDFCSYGERRE